MNLQPTPRPGNPCFKAWHCALVLCLAVVVMARRQACAQQPGPPLVLDRVVAVVNGRAILASDLTDEIRLSVLEPNGRERRSETPQQALQRLIARTLIRQQIRDEDEPSLTPTAGEVSARVTDLRKQLPACVQANCETDVGWNAFLVAHGLTQKRVEAYLRNRLEVLRFIEQRFRQGIQISPEEIEAYYRNTLLPQYPPGQPVPPLDQVSARIEEILLQQHVTGLFSGWLDNLRTQGDIEVLDPSLEAAAGLDPANPVQASSAQTSPAQKGPAVR